MRIKSIDGLDDVVPRNTLAAFAGAGLSGGGLRRGLLFLAVGYGVRLETKIYLVGRKRNGIGDPKIEDGLKNRRMAEIK